MNSGGLRLLDWSVEVDVTVYLYCWCGLGGSCFLSGGG